MGKVGVPDLSGLAERLASAVRGAGGRSAVASASGVPRSTLDRYLGARSEPPALTLARIAQVCDVPLGWLLGDGSPDLLSSGAAPPERQFAPERMEPTRGDALRRVEVGDPPPDGFVALPLLAGSAGVGRAGSDGPRFLFSETLLHQLGVSPHEAELAHVEGDSMFPTLQDGDMMLIDRGFGEAVHGKIYALVVDDRVVVKRVNIRAIGGMILISDNDRYPSETVSRKDLGNLTFQGRVAWFGRAL